MHHLRPDLPDPEAIIKDSEPPASLSRNDIFRGNDSGF